MRPRKREPRLPKYPENNKPSWATWFYQDYIHRRWTGGRAKRLYADVSARIDEEQKR